MKTILLIAMCLVFFAVVQGQEREINPGQSDITPPEFLGKNFEMLTQGKPCESLNDYLRGCACYPDECIKGYSRRDTDCILCDKQPVA